MPYIDGINFLREKETRDIFQTADPATVKALALTLVNGADSRVAAALIIADYFDDLAYENNIAARVEIWEEYSKDFDLLAFEEVDKISNDHLVFVMLNAPLSNVSGDSRSIMKLALDLSRLQFSVNHSISEFIYCLNCHYP